MNRLEKNAVDPATSRPEGRSIPQGAGQKHQSSPASKPKHPGSNGVNIDAARKPVGRLASEIAKILLGKDAATYAPHRTAATRVVVTRTDQMVFTGRKMAQKVWRRHSGYHGGLKALPAAKLMARDSRRVLQRAVKGMLPKNRLLKPRLKQLTLHRNGG